MKKRRTLIISLLLIAALALGIGYAALSRELIINSTAVLNANDEDFKVVFVSGSSNDAALATTTVTTPSKMVSYEVTGLSEANESVTLTYTVENQTADVYAQLTEISLTAGDLFIGEGTGTPANEQISTYFSKVVTITSDEDPTKTYTYAAGTPVPDDFIIAPGKTATVTVTVTLNQTVREEKMTLTGASIMLDFVDVDAPQNP